jgi:hypothetical protein
MWSDTLIKAHPMSGTITSKLGSQAVAMPDGARHQLLEGAWDATAVLLAGGDAIDATADSLPYVRGFPA